MNTHLIFMPLISLSLSHTHTHFNIIASWFTPYFYTSSSTLSRFLCSPCDFQHLLSLSMHSLFLFSHSAFQLFLFIRETQSKTRLWSDEQCEWVYVHKWFLMREKETTQRALKLYLTSLGTFSKKESFIKGLYFMTTGFINGWYIIY